MYNKQPENENIGEMFVKMLQNDIVTVWSSEVKPTIMTEKDTLDFEEATKCCICEDFVEDDKNVRDRDHFSGVYRGASH